MKRSRMIKIFLNGKKRDTKNLFEDLMSEACNELYHGCLEFSSLNFLVKLMHIKVLNGWIKKSFDMLLKFSKTPFSISTTKPTSLQN